MTEQEWLAADNPAAMLECLLGRPKSTAPGTFWPRKANASDRKLRLFAVACCRQVWHLLTDERSRRAVEVAERFADGEATEEELIAVRDPAFAASSHRRNSPEVAAHDAACGFPHEGDYGCAPP